MEKDRAETLLKNYHPRDQEERGYKRKVMDFLREQPDCFERSCQEGHFTASAWLLNKDETEVLLLHHAKLDMWLQLGGHCDGNPDLLAVAIKESQEESGVDQIIPVQKTIFDLDIHEIPRYKETPAHLHYDIRFLLKVNSDEKISRNRESKALRWFGKDRSKLPTTHRSIMRMFQKWVNLEK